MPVIPTIRLLFVKWTNAPFLLHIIEGYNFIFAGMKISREENFAKFHSQWILFSREENFLHAKNLCYTVLIFVKVSESTDVLSCY